MALKLKMLKKYSKDISVHPDTFIKTQSEGDSEALFQQIDAIDAIDIDRCRLMRL